MDLANVTTPLSNMNRALDPVMTIRNLRKLEGMERISGLWAFADYQQIHFSQALQRDLMSAGFQLIQAPRVTTTGAGGKATDDVELVNHADWLLDNSSASFDTVFLASGDRDFLRISQRFLNRGFRVYLVDPELLCASRDLRNAVNNEVNIIASTEVVVQNNHTDVPDEEITETPVSESTPQTRPERISAAVFSNLGADEIYEVLSDPEHPDHEQMMRCAEVLLAAEHIIRSQNQRGNPTAFKYLLNILADKSNYRYGGRLEDLRKEALVQDTAWAANSGVPEWVDGLGAEGIRTILTEFVREAVLIDIKTDAATTYTINERHHLYEAMDRL